VPQYRRRLPHVFQTDNPVFLTWRLHGSLPPNRHFQSGTISSGQAFVVMDRILDAGQEGPLHLKNPPIAEIVVSAVHHAKAILRHYELHAFVVMPNHVHMLLTPKVPIPILMKSLKSITAKRANAILGLRGTPFWQDESFDRNVRNPDEFSRIRNYIEMNPVLAGLVSTAEEYEWSSARGRSGDRLRTRGSAPLLGPHTDSNN